MVIDISSSLAEPVRTNLDLPVEAIEFIRKLRGGSQPSLVRGIDNKLYIVKCRENPQGANLLANEVLGNELMAAIGIPTASWKPIWVTTAFIEENPEFSIEAFRGRRPRRAGLYFGSEYIGNNANDSVYEFLPTSFVKRLTNQSDYWTTYIFDIFANHCDARQSIFRMNNADQSIHAIFIDNGHLFGGPSWDKLAQPGQALSMDVRFYPKNFDMHLLDSMISHFETSIYGKMSILSGQIPSFWYSGDLNFVMDMLWERLKRLRQLISRELHNRRVRALFDSDANGGVEIHHFEPLRNREQQQWESVAAAPV